MAKTRTRRVPGYLLHKPTGQARVVLNGKTHYLGVYGSPDSHARYAELIREWEKNERQPIVHVPDVEEARFSVADLFTRYNEYLKQTHRYEKNGKPTSQRRLIQIACDEFEEWAGNVRVHRTTSALVVQHRDRLEKREALTREGINRKVRFLLGAFRWGRQRGFVPKNIWADLASIEPLRPAETGRRGNYYPKRVPTMEEVRKLYPHCSRQVASMLELQLLTGMRPGEVCTMRFEDIEHVEHEGQKFGRYVVQSAKTEHHGHQTAYHLSPTVLTIIERFRRPGGGYVFRPMDAMRERSEERRRNRKTSPTKQMRERDAQGWSKEYAECYSAPDYRQAVERACKTAKVERFVPHALRHAFASWAANHPSLGAGAASAALNHRTRATTERYLHADPTAGFRVAMMAARELGA